MIAQRTLDDITNVLTHVTQIGMLGGEAFPEFDEDLLAPVLDEAGKLAMEILAPLNQTGDKSGVRLENGQVYSAAGFREAYQAFREGGWMGLPFAEAYGGQGLPRTLSAAVMESIQAANMSFSLCPMLSFAAIEALIEHGTEAQKSLYLPKLMSGEWAGTMQLTESQAGSDVGALKTRAVPNDDGSFSLSGQKIYITWGDHDLTENIVHLVLARLPDAPEGSRGISLFLSPKYLPDDNGDPGERNGVSCIGLEHKMGIHASPTCVMEYDGAKAWLIGEPNKGLAAMFTMMNSARLQVGIQGVAQSEAAYCVARAFADERKQGRAAGIEGASPIINHPDVQHMLLQMRARTMAARAICFECAKSSDLSVAGGSADEQKLAKEVEEILTPIAKSWSTDVGVLSSSLSVQIHGGMGFMGDTLASQIYRDSRIAPIYEGTNGIQAIDLVTRKLGLSGGEAIPRLLSSFERTCDELAATDDVELHSIAKRLSSAIAALKTVTDWMKGVEMDTRLFGATAYQEMFGRVCGVHYLARGSMSAMRSGSNSAADLAGLARFLAETDLGDLTGWAVRVRAGEAFDRTRRLDLIGQ